MKVAGMSTTTSALLLVLLVANGVSISEAVGGCGSHVTNGDRLFFFVAICPKKLFPVSLEQVPVSAYPDHGWRRGGQVKSGQRAAWEGQELQGERAGLLQRGVRRGHQWQDRAHSGDLC